MDTAENIIALGDVTEERKDKRKTKRRHSMKQALSVGAISEQNLEAEVENLASQAQDSRMEQTTGNQDIEGTEMCDSTHEGALLFKSSPVRADDSIASEDKSIERDAIENVVASGNLHEEKKDTKKQKCRKRKHAVSVAVNPEMNSGTKGEKFENQTQNIRQTTRNQALEGTENVVTMGNLHEEKKHKKLSRRHKSKKALSTAINPEQNLETKGYNLTSQAQNNEIGHATGNEALERTENRDNIVCEDRNIDQRTTDNVVTLGTLLQEKKVKRRQSKRSMKQAISAAAIPEKSSVTTDENFACQTQNSGIEQTTGNQSVEGTAMHDNAQEGASLLRSPPVRADDNIVSEVRNIDHDTLSDGPKDGKKRKKKRNRIVKSDLGVSCQALLLLKSSPVSDANHQEGTEMHILENAVTDNLLNIVSSGNDNLETIAVDTTMPMSVDSCFKMESDDSIKNVEPHVIRKFESGRQDKKTVDATDGTLLESMKKLDEMPGTTSSEGVLKPGKLKENEACANNVGSLSDVAADQEMQTPESRGVKRKWKKKNKKPAHSYLEELKEGERLPNQIEESKSIGDTDIALSLEGIMSLANESTHMVIDNFSGDKLESMADIENPEDQRLKGMALVIDTVKPPQDPERDQNVIEELVSHTESIKFNQESRSPQNQFAAHSEENICKIETVLDIKKTDVCSNHVVTAPEVAAADTENPDTCKKKKCQLPSVSRLELNDKDGAKDSTTESSSVNDAESKQSREGNNVAPGEGILTRTLLSSNSVEDDCGSVPSGEAIHQKILLPSPKRSRGGPPRRKLLILDINGLLADIVAPVRPGYKPDTMVSWKAVFRRPFCESFLQFCFENFDVGVWSSRVKANVDKVLDFLMGEMKNKLVFYWDRSHCTMTGFPTIENRDKPLVLKELKKLWDELQCNFAWNKGKYDQSNTLLLDDSPYKALRNPAGTAIFPLPYQYTDVNDCSLGPGGNLRVYLERLAMADNIPEYVRNNPFGQRPITETNLSWKYYKKVLNAHPS